MAYKITHIQVMAEETIDEETYKANIHLDVLDESGKIPLFNKVITVESSNSLTGYQVDEQREKAIQDYLTSINE